MGLTPREQFVIDHLERVAAAMPVYTGDYAEGHREGFISGLTTAVDTLRYEAKVDDAEDGILTQWAKQFRELQGAGASGSAPALPDGGPGTAGEDTPPPPVREDSA